MSADRITHDPVGLDAESRASRDATVLALEAARDRQRGFRPVATQPPVTPPSTDAAAAPAHSRSPHPQWHELQLSDLDTY